MDRIKLDLAKQFAFTTILTIRITDLNYGGHVGNDTFLSLLQEARQLFLKHFGYSELEIAGTGLIMVDAAIEYKKELNYADTIEISVAAVNFDKLGFDLHYLVQLKENGQLTVAAKAKTGMMCYDYANKKKTSVPPEAIARLSNG